MIDELQDTNNEAHPLVDERTNSYYNRRNPLFFRSIRNYFSLPKICDWIIVGVVVVCVIATIVLICI